MNKGNLRNGILFTLIATLLCCVLAVFCAWGIGGNTRNAAFADTSAAEAEEAAGAETGEENISTVAGETADGDDISTYTYVLNGTNNATTWTNAINDSVNNKRQVKVLLAADWTATANSSNGFGSGTGFNSGRLYLPATADIVLNLQTYTLNRNITQSSAYSGGSVIYTDQLSTLTVRGTTGRITGGYSGDYGGGIYANSYATINLEGGNITGNKAAYYGGVYMSSYCSFTMTGGSISNNESNNAVGGIFLNAYGSFTMTGGSISNNTSKSGETGGLRVDSGNIRLEGEAQIFGNTTHTYAGGVYANSSNFYMGGNAKVYNNVATTYAGGVYCNQKITIEGNAQVYNNVAGQNGGGVWWNSSYPFDIGGNAKIYGNSCGAGYEGGGIYSNIASTVPYYVVFDSEDLEIYENYRGGDKSDRTDIFLRGGNRIKFNIKLKTEKKIYIKLADIQGYFTENYDACYSATDPNTVFVSEDDSLTLSKIDNEAYLGLEGDAWSQAIAQSIATGKEVTYTVNSTWTAATDSTFTTSFGSTTNDAIGMGPYYRGALCIPWGANIRLVLNANINRNLSSAVANGMVIYIYGGTLTIEGTGSITGGYSAGNGGGIFVTSSGVLNFKSGKITGNKAKANGGGIYYGSGEVNISGGEISNNYCAYGGSATSQSFGGGVYVSYTKFNVSGNPKIINNYRISSSTANKDNICLYNNYKINIVAPLVSGASMGISPHSGVKILTNGYKTHHPSTSATAYFSADSYYTLIKLTTNSCNELALTGGVIPNWSTAVLNSLASGGAQQTCTISTNYTASSSAPLNIYATAFGLGNDSYGAYSYGRLNVPSGASVKINFSSSYSINRALNSSNAVSSYGQVIYIPGGGVLEISGSNGTITGGWSKSQSGGGVYISGGTFTMNAGTISGNRTASTSTASYYYYYGGGVYMSSGTFTMNAGTISGNYSGSVAGGVYYNGGTFNFYGGTITNNYSYYNNTYYTTARYDTGGGVFVGNSQFYVKGSGSITNNKNYYANGSTPNYSSNNSNLYISNTTHYINLSGSFTGTINTYVSGSNRLFTKGAGAYGVTSASRFPADSGSNSYNSTYREFQHGTYTAPSSSPDAWTNLVNSSINSSTPKTYTLSSNWVPTSGTSFGTAAGYINGAIKIPANANVIIDLNGYYIDRKADSSVISNGYAIYIEANAKVQIIDSSGKKGKIKSGHTNSMGGSIYANGNNISLTLDGVTLTGNTVYSTSGGGGLYFNSSGGTLNIKNSVITGNSSLGSGGGVYMVGSAETEVNLENSVISNNKVTGQTYYGGGIALLSGTLNMTGGEISGNSSIYTGGGVWVNNNANAKFNMTGGSIVNNSANVMGGGVYVNGSVGVFGIGGEIDISGNTLFNGTSNNIGLFSQKNNYGVINSAKVTLLDKVVTEERIGIASWDIDMQARLTIGFTDVYGNSMAPSKVFKLDNAVGVLALSEDGEVCIRVGDQWLIAVQESLLEPGVQKTITLSGDWMANVGIFGYDETAYTANGAILVPTGVDIVLDLAGWTISRGLEALTEGGAVFYIQDGATLTIIDSSSGKTGTISGGFNNGNGGAFNVAAGGTLKLKGGNVTENTASGHGAGIYFEDGAQLTVGGSAHVYGNVNGDGDASNLYIGAGQTVLVDGKFEENALIYVTLGTTNGLGAFTSGYGDSNVDDEGEYIKPYISFASDAGKAVALSGASTGSEVELYDDAWLAAVQKSLQTGDEVEYNLTGEWRGETGAFFSKTSRDEGTAYLNGALYIPLGAKIVINAGANTITRALGTAAANGSVFVVEGVLTLNGGTVTGGNSSGNGGGFVVNDGTLTLNGTNVYNNKAAGNGGGVYLANGTVTVGADTFIRMNSAVADGAGVYVVDGEITFSADSTVTLNTATGNGGGIYLANGTVTAATGSKITENKAANGAGAYVAGGTLTVAEANFGKNEAVTSGGGLYVADGAVTFTGATLSENKAANGAGAFIAGGNLEVNGADSFASNEASENGGGLYIAAGAEVVLQNTAFTENSAVADGGAVYVEAAAAEGELDGVLSAEDVTLTNNTAANGAGMYIAGTATVTGGTFTANKAGENGGAFYLDGGTLNLSGAVSVADNTAVEFGGGAYIDSDKFYVEGGISITDNKVGENSNNIYLANNNVINLSGKIEGASLSVTMQATGTFTGGWNDYYNLENDVPSDYFISDMGMTIAIKDGETEVRMGVMRPTWIVTDGEGNTTYPYTINTPYNGKDYTQYATIPVAGVEKWEYSTTIGNNYGRNDDRIWVGGRAAAEYSITFTLAKNYGWFDYEGTTFKLVWNIDAVVVDVEWTFGDEWRLDSEVTNGHVREYDGNGYPLTVKVSSTSGDVSIDESEYEIRYSKVGSSADSSLTAPRDAGSYYAYVNIKTNTNFRVESTSQADFRITPRVLTLTWYAEDGQAADSNTSVTYEYAAAPHVVTAELAAKVAASGILEGDTVNAIIEYYSESTKVDAVREVGVYRAVSNKLDNQNYVLDVEYECIINVIAYKLTLDWINETPGSWEGSGDSYTWEYNGRAVNLSVDAELFDGDTLVGIGLGNVTYELLGEGDESTLVATPTDIGRYKATVAIAGEHKNYDIQNAVMYFEITPKTIVISWKWATAADNELSEVTEDGNIMLRYDGTSNHTPNAYIHDDNVLNVFYNGSLLNKLNVKAVDENGNDVDPMGSLVETKKVFAVLAKDDAANYPASFYKNFVIDVDTGSQIFEIGRFVIPDAAIVWTDSNGDNYQFDGTPTFDQLPQYKWGTVSGTEGPGFSAHAEVSLGIVGYEFNHTANRYEDAKGNIITEENYGKVWPVDQNRGYKAIIKLTEEEYKLFEFANGTDEASITFYVMSITAEKEEITVIWLVKFNNTYYTIDEHGLLVEFTGTVAENSLPDAGKVEVADGKFAFTYNGAAQSPVAVYDKNGEYALLDMVAGTRATNVGDYTASLKASNVFEYNEGGMECEYSIKPLEVNVEWTGNTAESHLLNKFEWTYDGKEHKPLATAVSAVDGIELTVSSADITVSGAINAGTHTANAKLSGNFVIAEGATKQFTINKLKLGDGTVRWSAEDMKSDTPANPRDDYFWWYFDGNEHLPTPTASFTMLDGTTITLDLIVSGATKQVGTHYAYAVLDSTKLINNNFELGESKCMFIIHRILISNVTWTNSDEDSDDVTVEIEGKELLAFVYNGKEQAPRAYYLGDDGSRVYLDVSGAMTNVNVYTARIVSNELDFAEDLETTCNYAIVPRPVEISWSGDENLVYNGQTQYLTVTLTGEAEGETLVSGTDYVVTGFANAGTHNAVITFLNANYTYNDSNSHEFTIAKFDLGGIVKWTAEAEDGDKLTIDGEDISWQYNAKSHNPVLDEIETQTDADKLFINGVEFTFSYTGAASAVGVHTARATLLSALAGSVDVTDNFTVTTTKQFNITEYVIEVLWSGNDDVDDDNYGKLVWTYDGKAHAPTASYVDWTGATVNFEQVNGARVDAGPSYVASVQAPLNCVFSDEEGKGGEISFVINKAPITVVWKYENNGDVIADGEEAEWEYDGNAHAPEAYVSDEKLVVMGARTDAGVGYVASTTYGNPNYVLTNDRIQFNITARQVYIKWIGNPDNAGDADKEFTWVYPSGADKFVSPTAVLVDGEGNEILGSDNEPIEVTVRGAANSVGPFVAYAIDTFNNYDFADENNTWHTFTVIARKLQASDLQWIANGAIGDESGYDESLGAYVFTYTFNGKPQFPNIKVDDESFTYRIVSVKNADTSEAVPNNELPAIPGNWEVKFAPANSNYELPEEYAVTRIVILRKTVNVSWSGDKYVYNGGNQRPDAWFEDVDGKTVILEVTVDKSSYSAAGKYVATAALTSDYYALAKETQVKNYEITRKQIGLVWDSANASWVYDGQQHVVTATATMNDVVKDDLSKITIEYKITGANLTNPVVNGKVTNVGVYTAEAYLSGTAKDNYEIDKPKQEFSITRAPLSVKANDILTGVEYGDKAPVYTATFNGFVNGETEESLRIVVGGAPRGGWITSNYTSTSLPGEYSIVINGTTLAMLLPNYELEIGENGLLIVNAKEAYVIWVGQDNTKDFVYDGTEHKPTAYCYVNGDKVDLTVKYANYANGVYTEITEADYKAINAGDYYAIATGNTAGAVLQNAQTGYSIKQRSVVVNIGGNDGSVYTSVYGEEVKEVSYTYAESPLPADVSKFVIGFDINFVTDDGGFVVVNTNGYTIKGKWSAADPDEQATLANNYAVTFVGEREASDGSNSLGIYYVTQATVQVTNEKHSPDGKNYYDDWHEYDPLATRFFISLADKDNGKYKNVQFSGYQDAEVKIYYGGANSPENAPLPEDDTTYVLNNSPALTSEGQYVINYKIEIPNHETLYGAWTVIITPASEVIAIEFTKTLEVDFGNGVPEDLLGVLLGDYVVNSSVGMIVGEYMTVYHVTADEFLSHATARVQFGSEAVTAATNVGNYDVFIDVESTTENVNRVVRYHADVVGEDTNLGKYAVVPRLLTVDWGETGFEYEEGVTHTPAPVVSGWVNAEPFTVEGIQTSADGSIVYTTLGLTDAGVEISIKVGVNNDFTSVGGHNVTLAVESGNYRIAPENAYGTYSIKGVVNVPGPGGDTPPIVVEGSGIPNWMMYTILGGLGLLVLLVIIAMFVRRGVTVMGDADGFNEYYREDDQDEQDDD